jgi:predicted dehydrogenase
MPNITEPPINDLWTVPGEEEMLKKWQKEDSDLFLSSNSTEHYHQLQISEFIKSVIAGRDSAVPGDEGRKVVEIFEALYRSQRDRKPIKFPLMAEIGGHDWGGHSTDQKSR